ncbi:hypothetical protein YPPY16_4607, partial [Yersinia pestis PY-16]|jgi:hypothetical protein
MPAT